MSRYSNKNLVHVGDPYCAPYPFVIAEETISVMRKLYEDAHWRVELKHALLIICEKIEEASKSDLKVKGNRLPFNFSQILQKHELKCHMDMTTF